MSAVLKADLREARVKRAAMLRPTSKPNVVRGVESGVKLDVDMRIMSPRERHELCWKKL